jgi:hypothetical protein
VDVTRRRFLTGAGAAAAGAALVPLAACTDDEPACPSCRVTAIATTPAEVDAVAAALAELV